MLKQYWKKGKKAVKILKRRGVSGLYYALEYRLVKLPEFQKQFQKWILLEKKELKAESKADFAYQPLISIIVPVYNVAKGQLEECIESVRNQTSHNWELCIADDASTMPEVRETLKQYEADPRIKIVYRKENGHISRASNSAIELAEGEYIAFLDCDDVLTENAVYEMTKKLNEGTGYDFIYSDEDKIDEDGNNRHKPHFKPDWSRDTLLSHMYTCHFGMYRKSIAEEIGLLRPGYEGAQDYDFTLRFTEKTNRIGHIPKILYHWRERKESTSVDPEAKPYVFEVTKKAKEDAMKRRGVKASLEMIEETYQYRLVYETRNRTEENPLVSIIIETGDRCDALERCLKSVDKKTGYRKFEILVIDKSKREENRNDCRKLCKKYHSRYIHTSAQNKARIYNRAVSRLKGSYFLFLSDLAEVKESVWLERMLGQAMQEKTGTVGAKLVSRDPAEKIVSAGIVTLRGKPRHLFHGMSDHAAYYFSRNRMDYNYTAVSGKCMMIKRELFEYLEGFDERFAEVYYDVELCYRAVENGYFNVLRNDAVWYCEDDMEDGKMPVSEKERKLLYRLHPEQKEDRCYNRNLAQKRLDCGIRTV
jgi:glycosyltransferase involved in cell wall biosynthesis